MNNRISVKSDQQIVSTEAGLAATIGFASRGPVGGEMFFLTAPFIEHFGVIVVNRGERHSRTISDSNHKHGCRVERLMVLTFWWIAGTIGPPIMQSDPERFISQRPANLLRSVILQRTAAGLTCACR
jgi:hypothetical protein